MPLFILGVLVFISVAVYMYVLNNQERFVTKNTPYKGSSNVIYLPADLNAHKKKS
jgi:hypothetical protein